MTVLHWDAESLQAIEADPQCAMAHVAACVAKGRLTFFVDNRRKVWCLCTLDRLLHVCALPCAPVIVVVISRRCVTAAN